MKESHMLRIREVSDLHLEHYYDLYDKSAGRAREELLKLIPPLPTDKKSVLIVAGDLATAKRAGRIATFMELVVPRFLHTIYVLGNHEHYGWRMSQTLDQISGFLRASGINMDKLTIAGNEPVMITIRGVRFLCATLWTSYSKDEGKNNIIASYITDHKVITKDDGSMVYPRDLQPIHNWTVRILGEWMEGRDNSDTVIVTHHMPSYLAVHPMYMSDDTTRILNAAFTSDLDDFILKHQPKYWFFGHTHTSFIGDIGKTKLICNPLGYPSENRFTNCSFRQTDVYEIEGTKSSNEDGEDASPDYVNQDPE
jgi:predicted MPP superfamily phosphohydrolase